MKEEGRREREGVHNIDGIQFLVPCSNSCRPVFAHVSSTKPADRIRAMCDHSTYTHTLLIAIACNVSKTLTQHTTP